MVKIPLMVAKPIVKKAVKIVNKLRKDTRKFRKDNKSKDPSINQLNRAQERLETLDDVKDVTLKVFGKKLPKEVKNLLGKTFKDAAKKRATIRNIMADPKKINRKPNFKGGLIRKPKLAKKGY
jgi:nitrate reductase alpha subunit